MYVIAQLHRNVQHSRYVSHFKRKWFWSFCLLCLFWGGTDLNLLREEVRLYSCTPRNFSVSLREELKRTDAIFWPSCLLVKRCGGNCACCSHRCYDCQCVPTRVTKKYHEVNIYLNVKYDERVNCSETFTYSFWNSVKVRFIQDRHCV